jgi:hypothetical protein
VRISSHKQGDQMSLRKNQPKFTPTHSLSKCMFHFYRAKKQTKSLGYFCILFKKLAKVNNRPMCENSPNLVTLVIKKLGGRGNFLIDSFFATGGDFK